MPSPRPARKFQKDASGRRVLTNAVVRTYCDFGEPGRKTEIGQHLTYASAMREYARLWQVYHRLHGHRVWQEAVAPAENTTENTTEKATEKAAEKTTEKTTETKTVRGRTFSDMVAENIALGHKHAADFKAFFGTKIGPYMDKITGFDLLRFDDEIACPEADESCEQAVRRQWGDKAVALVQALIAGPGKPAHG